MKNYLFIGLILLLGCNGPNQSNSSKTSAVTPASGDCEYTQIEMKAYQVGTDKLLDSKSWSGCFKKELVEPTLGLVEITDTKTSIKILYYNETTSGSMNHLDVQIGSNEPSRWRANQGHDIFINETKSDLNFIFGDRKKSKIKGTIRLF